MDDLSGLDWSSSKSTAPNNKPPIAHPQPISYPSLQPTPSPFTSGRNTPLSAQGSGALGAAGSRPPTQKPAQDSFGSLLGFTGTKKSATANLSLREQQERLEVEKRRKEEERRKQAQAQFGDGQFWDTLGSNTSRTASPAIQAPISSPLASQTRRGLVPVLTTTCLLPSMPIQRLTMPATTLRLHLRLEQRQQMRLPWISVIQALGINQSRRIRAILVTTMIRSGLMN